MQEPQPVQRSSSRTVAIAAVVLLIVVAIAGIVLAGRHRPAAQPVTAALPVPAPTTPLTPVQPTVPGPDEVIFDTASSKLPAHAGDTLAKYADGARTASSMVRVSARYLTGENRTRDQDLAKARTAAVRHALEADGIKAERMQVELVEMPAGTLTERARNRVDLSLH